MNNYQRNVVNWLDTKTIKPSNGLKKRVWSVISSMGFSALTHLKQKQTAIINRSATVAAASDLLSGI
ncbi:hypothetical protein MGSAQ_001020 [marine sediment metagenome]|uniref:Uncharacterized protein n=1 Tax=marine sediment metagenome TaxID=412755 RepID=A0A1B6NVN1_9ZZZZ